MKVSCRIALLLTALLSACVAPVPAPAPAPAVRPLPPPPAPRAIGAIDWHDLPATPGVWQWRREGRLTVARFGDPVWFSLTCNSLGGTISLTRSGVSGTATAISILTTSLTRSLAVQASGDGVVATLSARDPLLDAMAYSRGRFAVKVAGAASLYLPSWPEVSRVIEDCR